MCYSEKVSWLTFAIAWFSTIAFALRREYSPDLVVLVSCVLFFTSMQFWEALLWRDSSSPFLARAAYAFNVLQPVVVAVVGLAFQEVSFDAKILTFVFLFFYARYVYTKTENVYVSKDSALRYEWWREMHAMPYAMFLVFSILTFLGRFRYPFLVIVLASLLVSIVIKNGGVVVSVNTHPATGSHWCWTAALGTLALHFF